MDTITNETRTMANLPLLNISFRRIGGICFLKLGRLTLSWSISRSYRPLINEDPTRIYADYQADKFRRGFDEVRRKLAMRENTKRIISRYK